MRRYNIISRILLILFIIDFAIAAPVSVQAKRQNVVHQPKDVINMLGERWEEDLEKLGEEYLKTGEKPVESSSSMPSGSDHGTTSIVQPPAPDTASSADDPDPSSCSPSTSSREGLQARGNCLGVQWSKVLAALRDRRAKPDDDELRKDGLDELLFTLASSESSSDHEFPWALLMQQKPVPVPNPKPLIHPLADPDFDWEHWINAEDPPPRPASPEVFGQAYKYRVDPLNLPSTSGHAPSPSEPEVVTPSPPSSNLELPSSSADSQLVDPQAAAIYAAKGKAKVSRRISRKAKDVKHAAQRELQPAERTLGQWE